MGFKDSSSKNIGFYSSHNAAWQHQSLFNCTFHPFFFFKTKMWSSTSEPETEVAAKLKEEVGNYSKVKEDKRQLDFKDRMQGDFITNCPYKGYHNNMESKCSK